MTVAEKAIAIIEEIRQETSTDVTEIFNHMAVKPYVAMHGPEHHILDGACLLTAYYNAGGQIDLQEALEKLFGEGIRMPGAMCGLWGVCGAITSIGAALAIIDHTGPLSQDGTWGDHMAYTSAALSELGKINGPRCCKRDAMVAFKNAVAYVNEHYPVKIQYADRSCTFSAVNQQCIRGRCPFYK